MHAPPPPAVSLAFTALVRGFGGLPVLRGVSGAVAPGELLLVTGANGSGKSTLLRCLAGLLRPQGGEIVWREAGGALGAEGRRRRAGYLAPDLALYDGLTAAENLDLFATLRRLAPGGGRALLERLAAPPDRPWAALSSGMRQRVRWAWALLHRPAVLLLDEPFQNLDPPGEAAARQLLAEHLAGGGLAVVATPSPLALPAVTARLELT